LAAYCLLPLSAWVAFATILNFSIWLLCQTADPEK
jgi:tryptophan-rich sensory protein